jgi:hypothetical protein
MIERRAAEAEASALMLDFAERTGLGSRRPPRRYLWTDAFAVCNLLALAKATGEGRFRDLALALVEQVHRVLGRHRADDRRTGWISGLGDEQGERHPTRRGLRIGKPLPERAPGEPLDERLEWERDGQYFHYLTKWMHALDQTSRATHEPRFNAWARELAEVAHRAFCAGDPGPEQRMVWKLSIDLSRPLVGSMGQHDPIDGLVTCLQLCASAAALPGAPAEPGLKDALRGFAVMARQREWATADPLGIGGLLIDACRVEQLRRSGVFDADALLDPLLERLLEAASAGLSHYAAQGDLRRPASQRLAFRELGLAIGLCALDWFADGPSAEAGRRDSRSGLRARVEALARYRPLGSDIEAFWLDPAHRRQPSWAEHRDINDVMLATRLVPEGLLSIEPVGGCQ